MRIITLLFAFALATPMLFAQQPSKDNSRTLILFYSQTETTKQVAKELQKRLGADIEEIKATVPYSGTYDETIARCQDEMKSNSLPHIRPIRSNLRNYDTIYIGYPVWFGTFARPMLTFINSVKLADKKIIPFCTFGSGGLIETTNQLKKALPLAKIQNGFGIRQARISYMTAELDRFLKVNGYVEGEVEQLPEYSEFKSVSEEDVNIFNSACAGYKYPLGTPVTVCSRKTSAGTDYLFIANSKNQNGETIESKIYITVENNKKPEFTLVVR